MGAPVALGLPTLEAALNRHGEAYADGKPLPTRFGVWFFGTGVHEGWAPAETGALKLPEGFTPLQRHLSKVSIVSGLKFDSFGDYGTNRHHMGASSVLAGAPPVNDKPGGITLDQLVAQHWKETPLASLEVGTTYVEPISYNAANGPNKPLRDPPLLWQRLFGGPSPSATRSSRAR